MRSYHFKLLAVLLTLGLGLALATHYHNLPALSVPEPPCALCEGGGGMWYHAPCVLALSPQAVFNIPKRRQTSSNPYLRQCFMPPLGALLSA